MCRLTGCDGNKRVLPQGQRPAARMKVKWTTLGMVVFFLLSVVMTCCFIWQYRIPKLRTGNPPHTPTALQTLLELLLELRLFVVGAAGGLHTDGKVGLAVDANSCWGGG